MKRSTPERLAALGKWASDLESEAEYSVAAGQPRPQTSLVVCTARYTTKDPDRLDVTRLGAIRYQKKHGKVAPGEFLAPSNDLLWPHKRARAEVDRLLASNLITLEEAQQRFDALWSSYQERFRGEMRRSYLDRRAEWNALLARPRVTLVCFCRWEQCHRYLLAGFLVKLGAAAGGELEA